MEKWSNSNNCTFVCLICKYENVLLVLCDVISSEVILIEFLQEMFLWRSEKGNDTEVSGEYFSYFSMKTYVVGKPYKTERRSTKSLI